MPMRIIVALASILAFGMNSCLADASQARRHHRARISRGAPPVVAPAPYDGPTLVLHPASNIACDTPYRATRALPCDQPVWVYGSPCEVDLGLGRSRSCDWR